jgi:hypothetical protein
MNQTQQNLPEYPGDNLLYLSGLTAHGGWDELDDYQRDCVIQLIQLTAKHCAHLAACNAHVQGFALHDLICDHFGCEQ